MNIFTNLWNNWTTYEKITTSSLILIILIFIPLVVFLFTRRKDLTLISLLSLAINGILGVASLFVLNKIFGITITEVYKLVPVITLFADIFCIGAMTGFFTENRRKKDFNDIQMKTECVRDNFRLSVSLILLLSGVSILTPSISTLLLLSLGLSLGIIWITYALVYKLFKL